MTVLCQYYDLKKWDFYNENYKTRDVDTVLTSAEVIEMIQTKNIDFTELPLSPLDQT